MILVTGSSGVTGKTVIESCLQRGLAVRACVHSNRRIKEMHDLGASEVIVANMEDAEQMQRACDGIDAVYHICPTMNENERKIGHIVMTAAKSAGVEHFVFQSVLHSVLDEMPHHAAKHDVERMLAQSGIPYTVIQPAVLMQNMAQSWHSLLHKSILVQKYYANDEARMNMVDFGDVAEAVALILSDPAPHDGATYEFCGPHNLTRLQMQNALEEALGRSVRMKYLGDDEIIEALEEQGASDYRIQGMLKMFRHYNTQGFVGSSLALRAFLGRRPTSLTQYVKKLLS